MVQPHQGQWFHSIYNAAECYTFVVIQQEYSYHTYEHDAYINIPVRNDIFVCYEVHRHSVGYWKSQEFDGKWRVWLFSIEFSFKRSSSHWHPLRQSHKTVYVVSSQAMFKVVIFHMPDRWYCCGWVTSLLLHKTIQNVHQKLILCSVCVHFAWCETLLFCVCEELVKSLIDLCR